MRIADLPWGWVGSYDDNEVEIVSTIADPPKVRLAVQADRVDRNLGAVSFNLRRADGRHEEYGYVMGQVSADQRAGAMYVAVRPADQQDCRQVLYLHADGAFFRVPVQAPNLGVSGGTASILRAPGGETELHMQGDGNLVVYDVRTDPWTPLWASAQGKIRDFRAGGRY